MDNKPANILEQLRQRIEDMQKELDSLKLDLEALKASEGQLDVSSTFDEPVDISIEELTDSFDSSSAQSQPEAEPEQEPQPVESEQQPQQEAEPEQETQPVESEPKREPVEDEPQQPEAEPQRPVRPAVAWKVDIPGSPISNVISGISLNDRVLFINTLFKEDPMLFQSTINAFNTMSHLEDAEDYIISHFPEWNINSDIVYRLMMAVRRKLR